MNARAIVAACMLAIAHPVVAHADALDKPVVAAAREALRTGDFSPIAIWVEPPQEAALQSAFRHALAVRALGADGRALAESFFLETAVRLHRESSRTSICVAASNPDAATHADDRAVLAHVRAELDKRMRDVEAHRPRRRGDIAAGRAYAARYRELARYISALYAAAATPIAPQDEARGDNYEL